MSYDDLYGQYTRLKIKIKTMKFGYRIYHKISQINNKLEGIIVNTSHHIHPKQVMYIYIYIIIHKYMPLIHKLHKYKYIIKLILKHSCEIKSIAKKQLLCSSHIHLIRNPSTHYSIHGWCLGKRDKVKINDLF